MRKGRTEAGEGRKQNSNKNKLKKIDNIRKRRENIEGR
jgi:hypothetical protein